MLSPRQSLSKAVSGKETKAERGTDLCLDKGKTMELDKIRGLATEELKSEEAKASEQLFRIRFAKSLGKQEGVARIGSLKKEIARFKTVARERQLAQQKAGV